MNSSRPTTAYSTLSGSSRPMTPTTPTGGGGSAAVRRRAAALQRLLELPGMAAWEGEELSANLVVAAVASGARRRHPACVSKATPRSVFNATLLKFLVLRDSSFFKNLAAAMKLVRLETDDVQRPALVDDGTLPRDFSLLRPATSLPRP